MTHKKFHRIRLASMICSTVIIALLIACVIILAINSSEKLIPLIIAVGAVALILFLFFGRIFCGFLCPLGFFQDIIWRVTERLHLPKLSRNEKFMKVIHIFNRIFLAFFICGIVSLIVIFVFSPKILSKIVIPIFVPIIIVCFMIVLNLFARRFFCNVCPIGSFIGIFEKLNIIKLEKDCDTCTMCGACYEACPMRIKNVYTEIQKRDISDSRCLYCGECIKKCQVNDALAITVCGKRIYKSSKEDFLDNQFADITLNKKDEK